MVPLRDMRSGTAGEADDHDRGSVGDGSTGRFG